MFLLSILNEDHIFPCVSWFSRLIVLDFWKDSELESMRPLDFFTICSSGLAFQLWVGCGLSEELRKRVGDSSMDRMLRLDVLYHESIMDTLRSSNNLSRTLRAFLLKSRSNDKLLADWLVNYPIWSRGHSIPAEGSFLFLLLFLSSLWLKKFLLFLT